MARIGLGVDDAFLDRLDSAVIQFRRAHPERNTSRSAFMKLALERMIAETTGATEPKARVRQRSSAAA